MENQSHVLSLMTFTPAFGALIILFIPKNKPDAVKIVAAVATAIPLILAVHVFFAFDRTLAGVDKAYQFQFVERYKWIPPFNIEYYMGIDGISVLMVLLTALIGFICIFASWGIDTGVKGYFALFLILQTGMMGVFCALDFFLFYVFWEVVLLPMYFLIGIWGGPNRVYAAIKFFLYTLLGSVFMLVVMLIFYFNSDIDPSTPGLQHTFNMVALTDQDTHHGILAGAATTVRWLMFAGLLLAFAIKIPAFPFHTWLPDAHVEAPTPISVILAGILLKMGTYGLMRISYPILPDIAANFAWIFALWGMVNIVYGALAAMAQTDLKKLVAYSSISHMGYVMLGMAVVTVEGMTGALLQMFNHGTITGMLFLIVGVIYDRVHHRDIEGFGGLASVMPVYTGITSLAFFASLGLPGLSGFISEVLVFIGAFKRALMDWSFMWISCVSVTGIIITAAYSLWTVQRIFFGPLNEKYRNIPEINGRELFTLLPLGIIVIFLGIYPMPALKLISSSVTHLVKIVGG